MHTDHRMFLGFNQDKRIALSRDEFAKGYSLYVLCLISDICDESHLNSQHEVNLRSEIKFTRASEHITSELLYAVFENIFKLQNPLMYCAIFLIKL